MPLVRACRDTWSKRPAGTRLRLPDGVGGGSPAHWAACGLAPGLMRAASMPSNKRVPKPTSTGESVIEIRRPAPHSDTARWRLRKAWQTAPGTTRPTGWRARAKAHFIPDFGNVRVFLLTIPRCLPGFASSSPGAPRCLRTPVLSASSGLFGSGYARTQACCTATETNHPKSCPP